MVTWVKLNPLFLKLKEGYQHGKIITETGK